MDIPKVHNMSSTSSASAVLSSSGTSSPPAVFSSLAISPPPTMSCVRKNERVDQEAAQNIIKVIREIAAIKQLDGNINQDTAVNIMQMMLLHFNRQNFVQEGQELINNLNDRPPINQDFSNIDDMVNRLCMKQKTKRVFEEINR